jgi:serine/threonine protein kinase
VFQPGINCNGEPSNDPQYITKIETQKSTIKNELSVSKKIQTIPNYEEGFSPIIENCPVQLSSIDNKAIEECKIIKPRSNEPEQVMDFNKIKYAGKRSLGSYLMVILKENPERFMEFLVETHLTLLDDISELNKVGVVHNDIKENNIMCRDVDGRPIIIDFGLSMEKEYIFLPTPEPLIGSLLSSESSQSQPKTRIYKYFFKYDPTYNVWCIDIHLLNYMLDTLNQSWLESIATQEQINNLLSKVPSRELAEKRFSEFLNRRWLDIILELNEKGDDEWIELIYDNYGYQWRTKLADTINNVINGYIDGFMTKDDSIKSQLFTKDELDAHRVQLTEFFSKYESQPWETLFNDLITYQETWDNYALSFIYITIMKMLELDNNEKITAYISELKTTILSDPSARKRADETKNEIIRVIKTVPKTMYESLIETIFGSKERHSELHSEMVTTQLDEVKNEALLYQSKRL